MSLRTVDIMLGRDIRLRTFTLQVSALRGGTIEDLAEIAKILLPPGLSITSIWKLSDDPDHYIMQWPDELLPETSDKFMIWTKITDATAAGATDQHMRIKISLLLDDRIRYLGTHSFTLSRLSGVNYPLSHIFQSLREQLQLDSNFELLHARRWYPPTLIALTEIVPQTLEDIDEYSAHYEFVVRDRNIPEQTREPLLSEDLQQAILEIRDTVTQRQRLTGATSSFTAFAGGSHRVGQGAVYVPPGAFTGRSFHLDSVNDDSRQVRRRLS
jgi:hypothetical protein